ncbi:hypothetical protein [Desulfuromonas soudanensis]|uniref:hypothetical protein n=1 Tax=Desulfuromonas soudanensis TaxID=1603606 RepID=UPI0018DF4909|nr:hypothetical protein [Desulfuromonas soudanensis]
MKPALSSTRNAKTFDGFYKCVYIFDVGRGARFMGTGRQSWGMRATLEGVVFLLGWRLPDRILLTIAP